MRRIALAATFALFSLGSIATANAQSFGCSTNNQAVGGIVGALAGGTVGGLITNDRRGRSFRGDRGFHKGSFSRGRGFRGGRGFGRGRGFRRGNNGAGIAIGAIAGGLIGSQLAAAQDRNCRQLQNRRYNSRAPFGGTRQDQRRSSAPFGGQQPYRTQPTRTSAPVSPPPPLSAPSGQQQTPSNSRVFQPVCQFVNQTTELPNGQSTSQRVEVCQFSPNGEWIPR